MRGYVLLFLKEIITLNSIDILIFSIWINLNISNYFMREIQLLFALFIIRKFLIEHTHTNTIKGLLFLAGSKTRKVILLNLGFNNLIFVTISILMILLNITTLHFFIENLLVLNFIISISGLVKFIFPFYQIKEPLVRTMFQSIIYFTFFGVFFYSQKFSIVVIFLFYTFIIHYFNRTLIYDDIS